ncbi:hypothetical protein OG689_21305 [Kitasatospora sp. NBC_00240]|uniref:hypothetical protein n=1 Tax=Kitasatospora sp. NBC_00240 TaxID=2903567 RepID=UPI002258BDFE|nr:hypothetical protein [Kitasatospora sp. NBC_00240]MCX5211796.1 hypothetical protein [Kitasatospora sp. NBC_00240]
MRASGISAFTKNVPSLSRRSALTLAAATLVVGAGLPVLGGADSAWACGAPDDAPVTAPSTAPAPAVTHNGGLNAGFFMLRDGLTITAGGAKLEIPVEVGNFTGAPYEKVVPQLSLYNEKAGSHPGGGTNLRTQDFVVEVSTPGGWQKLPMVHSCDPVIYADTSSLKGEHLDNGRATHFTFRFGMSANAPKDQTEIKIGVNASAEDENAQPNWTFRNAQVKRPAAPAPGKTTPPAGPQTTAKPTATPAAPAAGTKAAAPATGPAAEAPATAAPAALAETGAGGPNGLLAGSAAAFVALGAGVLIAVRRLRNQG